jgi:hypothetical protein
MIRLVVRGLAAAAAVALLLETSAGQPPALDKVYVRDKKDGSAKTHEGSVKFGPGGYQVVAPGKTPVAVRPDDLIKVVPGDLPGSDRGTVMSLITEEEKKTKADYERARVGYADLLKKAGAAAPEPTRRFLDFKHVMMATKVADESADDEKWQELADAAAKSLDTFLGDYRTGWEIWPVTRARARLLTETNKYDEVARLWTRTTKVAELPADLKLEAELRAIDAEIRSKGHPTALGLAKSLAKAAGPGAARDKLTIYEAAADFASRKDYDGGIKVIEKVIADSKDPGVRGVGYGMIGELQLLAGKPREAMWSFLWVETVFSHDKDDTLAAMCRLVEVFRAQGDEERARSYREKIRRFRETL